MGARSISDEDAALVGRIRILSEQVWENRIRLPDIELWLDNFCGNVMSAEDERANALHLLAHFNYFGSEEIRILLRSVYRDLFRYPLVQKCRQSLGGTHDTAAVDRMYTAELGSTRFAGMGTPAASGTHLLYILRQESGLREEYFIDGAQLAKFEQGTYASDPDLMGVRRLVFIDDILGSGQQVRRYTGNSLNKIKAAAAQNGHSIELNYYVLFAKSDGLAVARGQASGFSIVEAIHELDESENAFDSDSSVFATAQPPVTLADARSVAEHYGDDLLPGHALGYRNGQLLLGLHHNVPDNTLPIFWHDEDVTKWTAIFPRRPKV